MLNCKNKKTGKIAIDIDNTICNTSDFFGDLAIKYDRDVLHKNSAINFDKVVPRSDEWTKEELSGFVEKIFNKEAINIPVKADVSCYVKKLKEKGFEILFITNRGIKEDDHTDLIVPAYLQKNDIPYDGIITKSNDKFRFLNDCDYFVDDDVKNCEDAQEKTNCKVLMMVSNKTKNYNNVKITKAKDWKDVYNIISFDCANKSSKGLIKE